MRNREKGVALVEVLVGVTIIAVMTIAVGLSITTYLNARASLLTDLTAVYLAEEGYELVRALRNDNWTSFEALSIDTPLYLDIATTTISVGSSPESIDGVYTRQFTLRDVYRNGSDDITASTTSGASVDSDMREVVVEVGGPNGTTSFTGIVSNIFAL